MTDRHRPAVDVQFFLIQPGDLLDGQRDDREGLVDFEQIDL